MSGPHGKLQPITVYLDVEWAFHVAILAAVILTAIGAWLWWRRRRR
ncbi:hypothetical protein [Caulobacter mirabilis]|nr:hypothetical protein [Caulobacter mirabilis]